MTSLLPNRWYRLAFSLLLGVFLFVTHSYALEINKLELQRVLSSQSAIMNISLFVMIDMLLSCYFCVARIEDYEDSKKFRWYTRIFRFMPSLLIFPALYYIQITLFFTLTGVDFTQISAGLITTIVVLFVAASFFMRKILDDKDLLIELVILLTLFVCALVICCTIFHPSATIYNHATPIDWKGCATTLGFLSIILFIGYLWAQIVRHYKQYKKVKNK